MKCAHKHGSESYEVIQFDGKNAKDLAKLGGDRISIEGKKVSFTPYSQPSYDYETDKPEGQQNPHAVIYQPPDEKFEKGDWIMLLPDGRLHKFSDEDFRGSYVEVEE